MSFHFEPGSGPIIVRSVLVGTSGHALVRLALDTGATRSLINTGLLVSIGYDPELSQERIQVSTGSGIESVSCVDLHQITALGKRRTDFPVLSHTLPPSTGVDGVLGLDFLADQVLTIDFRRGLITLQ